MMGNRGRRSGFKSRVCETCGTSKHVVPILYGLLSEEGMKAVESGKYVLGGCCIDEKMPTFYCKKCDGSW
jgi:hypothetical protein